MDFVKHTEAVPYRNVYNIPALFELVLGMLSSNSVSESSSLSTGSSASVSLSIVVWEDSLSDSLSERLQSFDTSGEGKRLMQIAEFSKIEDLFP